MKYIVIVPDGAADYPLEELRNKTPLEVARTTNLDFMAQNGFTGLVKTIPDSLSPGSDVGNLALLGYDPQKCYSGRAPLEAASLGIELKENEIAFRCNLVTVEGHTMEDYSAGHIPSKEASILIETLNKEMNEPDMKFVAGKSYRHLLIMKVLNVDALLKLQCTPPHDILGKDITKHFPEGPQSLIILKLMEKSRKILENHGINKVRVDLGENTANMIWLWGQGIKPQLPLFKDKHGLKGGIISAVDLINGIGRLTDLKVIQVPGITGYYDTNYNGKAQYALEALKDNDFVFIHIEGPDEAGHNGDAKAKIQCIEHIDREIIGTVLNHFDKNDNFRIMVLPDHPTPVSLRTHARDPVPFVMYGKGIPKDSAEQYNEKTAKEKGLKFKSGEELMEFFLKKHL